MPDFARALAALGKMARLADQMVALQAADRGGRGRYERLTNDYQAELTTTYDAWVGRLIKGLTGDWAHDAPAIEGAMLELERSLQDLAQAQLPWAVTAIGVEDYVPSAEAWRMIADAITQNNSDVSSRLVPEIHDKLLRGLTEELDLAGVAQSLTPRVAFYAGNFWVVIQRLVGDFAAQAETRDDLIYPCRWVWDPQAKHCDSCPQFAGEYESYAAMLAATNQCVPGYFVGSPYKSCWLNCRCHLELYINGKWVRV